MNPQRSSLTATLLILSIISYCSTCEVTCGQLETPSHRKLELPNSGLSDLKQQMQMLQQLQTWMGQKPESETNEDLAKNAGIKPEQLDAIKKAMQQFGIPEGSLPDLSMIPPEVISQAMNDLTARQQIKDLLEGFSRTRQMPPASNGGENPVLPPSENNGGSRSRQPQQQYQAVPPGSSAAKNSATGTSSSAEAEAGEADSNGAIEDIQKRFDELRQRMQGNRSAANNNSGQPQNPTRPDDSRQPSGPSPPNNGKSGNGQPNNGQTRSSGPKPNRQSPTAPQNADPNSVSAQLPQDEDAWNKLLEDLIRQQRESGQSQPLPPFEVPINSDSAGQGSGLTGNSSQSPQRIDTADIKSVVSEFLKNQEQLKQSASDNSAATSSGTNTSAVETEQARVAEEVRQKQQQAKSDLEQNGFQATLKKIARDAKKQVESGTQTGSAGGDSSTGMNKAFFQILNGIGKDIVEIAKTARADASGNRSNPAVATRDPAPFGDNSSSWTKSAGDLISGLATAPEPATANSRSGSTTTSIGAPGSGWVFTFFVLLIVAVAAAIMARKTGLLTPLNTDTGAGPLLSPTDIHSRHDVVLAFHQLALQPSRHTQLWWTHKQVEDQIAEASPEIRTPMSTLANLYEQARYLPEDTDFDEEKLTAARTALKLCRS